MAKAKYARDSANYIQVRLARDTADRLKAFALRLREWCLVNPGKAPAWLDDVADSPVTLNQAVLTLLFREDCHSARSRRQTKAELDGQRRTR